MGPGDTEMTLCRFRGEEMHVADARMQLTKDELAEVEVLQPDGTFMRVFRDSDSEEVTLDEFGGLHIKAR